MANLTKDVDERQALGVERIEAHGERIQIYFRFFVRRTYRLWELGIITILFLSIT